MSDNVQDLKPKAQSQGDISMPPMPPHFWVSGWDWLSMHNGTAPQIPANTAMTVFVSLSRPNPEKHPEAFLAMPEMEHQMFLRLNRAEVWKQVVDIARGLHRDGHGLFELILLAHKRGKAEFEAL